MRPGARHLAVLALGLAAAGPAARAYGEELRFTKEEAAQGYAVVLNGGVRGRPDHACFTCHGYDGVADPSGAFPRIAGQPAWYLFKQLEDYAAGTRPNAIMSPIARALSGEEMHKVAAWYALQAGAPYYPRPVAEPLTLQRGGALSAVGDPERGIRACADCHAPGGTGAPPSFPYLAGQYAPYQILQLELWREGVRRNDPLGVMAAIARRMSDDQIRAVSLYFEAARPILGQQTISLK
jgi:cytochrome c553